MLVEKKHSPYAMKEQTVSTDITRIRDKAQQYPKLVFTSLYHHVTDIDNLRECYKLLDGNKSTGIDRVSKIEYGKNLKENLQDLSNRLKRMGYRPQPKRRVYIPKPGSDKLRPLGNHTCRMNGELMLHVLITAKILPVWVLNPSLDNRFIGFIVCMF